MTISSQGGLASIRADVPMSSPYRRAFTPGRQLTFVHAKSTQYEKEPILVTYVEPYAHGFDEHVVILPNGNQVAILDRDIVA